MLVHAFPDADIPVVQLSINADKPFDYHLELGAKLAPLRDARRADRGQRQRRAQPAPAWTGRMPDAGFDWAQRFDDDAREHMLDDPTEVAGLDAHRDFRRAAPTPDHFIPLLYLAGLAGRERASRPTCWSTATPTAPCP